MIKCSLFVLCLLAALCFVSYTVACNKNVCASLVSKCLLLKSCECDMSDKKNCSCCRDCHKCLERLYTDCCSCVGMCPDQTHDEDWLKSSTVEELRDPLPELFNVLTDEEDIYKRWTTFNYPAHLDLLYFKPHSQSGDLNIASNLDPTVSNENLVQHGGHQVVLDPNTKVMNCTVAYMTPCMSLSRCRASCQSMGAARYRWFHEHGCCECIGSTCLDYGKGEAHCLKCPLEDDEEEEGYHTGSEEAISEKEGENDNAEETILQERKVFGLDDTVNGLGDSQP